MEEIRTSIDSVLNGLPDYSSESDINRGILTRFKDWITKFVEVEEDDEDGINNGEKPNKYKLKQILQQCNHYFDCLFQTCTDNNSQNRVELETSLNDSLLSPVQRYSPVAVSHTNNEANDNIMNNSQNLLKIQYMGDPVLRAIQPNENKFLCRHLHKLSQYINRKFAPQLVYVSNNQDFWISRIANIFLNERPSPSCFEQSTQDECDLPRLRINLRPFASYHTMFFLLILVTLPYLFGITSFHFILISLFLLIILISIPMAVSNKH